MKSLRRALRMIAQEEPNLQNVLDFSQTLILIKHVTTKLAEN